MTEEKRKINAWIPIGLYEKIGHTGSGSITEAIVKGLELLLQNKEESIDVTIYKKEVDMQRAEITILKEKLDNAPIGELEQLKEHNNTLKKELQDLKDIHNNYMMQVQMLLPKKSKKDKKQKK